MIRTDNVQSILGGKERCRVDAVLVVEGVLVVLLIGAAVACGTPPTPVVEAAKVPEGAGCDVAADKYEWGKMLKEAGRNPCLGSFRRSVLRQTQLVEVIRCRRREQLTASRCVEGLEMGV